MKKIRYTIYVIDKDDPTDDDTILTVGEIYVK